MSDNEKSRSAREDELGRLAGRKGRPERCLLVEVHLDATVAEKMNTGEINNTRTASGEESR